MTEPAGAPAAAPISLGRRIVTFPLTLLVLGFAWIYGVSAGAGMLVFPLIAERNSPLLALAALLIAALVIGAYKLFKLVVERERDTEFAARGAAAELALGLAGGMAVFSLAVGIVALLGGFEVLGLRGTGDLWSMLALAVFSGVIEEVLFRGLVLRQLERLAGSWIALAITSVLFGALHIFNPGATWFTSFAIAMEAGLLLGGAYLLTRRLWLAVGLHAAWNFAQGWIYSIPVSGTEPPLGLLITRRVGPDWLTGGQFGLEASVVALVVATAGGAALLLRARARGRIVPAPWRRT